ncbi:twin-arginine translocation signal domain-containing protein [Thiosulfativibrio zosterae]|uniref:Twin-arginine translocation signal domain-containing protein n=1 Tax=Thiosulfativibrio zosterae TaxID=2675053 RepID=A0A6F8PRC3_9GAMM|nr:twin-arginine translocation signal domain-containing protein [Thiosulfativibrio zosterae]BBP44584.1 hypothetical protein THMIRHAT_23300 [Thiosulfativibrio zosterae]
MSNQSRRNFLKMAGAGIAALATGQALASENPFGFQKIAGQGQQLAAMEGKCGEGKCGAKMQEEGKCGGKKDEHHDHDHDHKMDEGKCGGKMKDEGKCGAKMKEGKCGGQS